MGKRQEVSREDSVCAVVMEVSKGFTGAHWVKHMCSTELPEHSLSAQISPQQGTAISKVWFCAVLQVSAFVMLSIATGSSSCTACNLIIMHVLLVIKEPFQNSMYYAMQCSLCRQVVAVLYWQMCDPKIDNLSTWLLLGLPWRCKPPWNCFIGSTLLIFCCARYG